MSRWHLSRAFEWYQFYQNRRGDRFWIYQKQGTLSILKSSIPYAHRCQSKTREKSIGTRNTNLLKTRAKIGLPWKMPFFDELSERPKRDVDKTTLQSNRKREVAYVVVCACSMAFYFLYFLGACLFFDFSFINALILLVSFSFFRLFFVSSTHATHTG